MNKTAPPETAPTRKATKKRVRNFSSEDRAAHRIFEKGRREAFKERLTELAGQLPILSDTDPKHHSKHVVVNESIARHKLLESRCVDALRDLKSLIQERDELLAEVNTWRRGAGTSPRQPKCASSFDGLVEIEKQSQQRASSSRLSGLRRYSDQNGGSSDDRNHIVTVPGELTMERSHTTQVLPMEPTHDLHALSDLESLLLDPSWSEIIRAPPAVFPAEPSVTISNRVTSGSNTVPDSLPIPASNMGDYQSFGDIGLHQQMPLLNMDSTDFSPPDAHHFSNLSNGHLGMDKLFIFSDVLENLFNLLLATLLATDEKLQRIRQPSLSNGVRPDCILQLDTPVRKIVDVRPGQLAVPLSCRQGVNIDELLQPLRDWPGVLVNVDGLGYSLARLLGTIVRELGQLIENR
ncbi:hypothetical protein CI238_01912, partial [Colletotrichum incanum]